MQARVKWDQGVSFIGESGSGHTVVMDGAPALGGENRGARPMEMLLIGLGGCSAFDVVFILQKGRHPVTDCEVEIEAQRASEDPKVFTKIHLHFKVKGAGLQRQAVQRAVSLSAEKYCSASVMLAKTAEISHDFELVTDG